MVVSSRLNLVEEPADYRVTVHAKPEKGAANSSDLTVETQQVAFKRGDLRLGGVLEFSQTGGTMGAYRAAH